MEARDIFRNISPIDHRYSISEKDLFDRLVPWISEDAAVSSCVKAELALVKAHLSVRGSGTAELLAAVDAAESRVTPEAVYAEEEKTRHNVRALVNVLKKEVPTEVAPLVHLGATSVDILDTALSYRMKGVSFDVVLPMLRKLVAVLCGLAEREAETPQVGRTHGQHAVPITFGFAVSEYVSRLGKCVAEIEQRAGDLRGKLAGAVGAYNATSALVADPRALERAYLSELGLEPSEHSTQLVEPEYLLRLLLELNVAFGVIANLADDFRNLQRSEIGEIRENFGADQVGSSTMPQKRNPWNSEHVKSLWKAFSPRVATFFMDQISEHQRDLTNSASQRFVADYVAGFCQAVKRMTEVVEGLGVNRAKMLENLRGRPAADGAPSQDGVRGGVLAEPAYILLAEAGESDAHEVIRRITLDAETRGVSFSDALAARPETLARIGKKMAELGLVGREEDALEFFQRPERYRGLAAEKATELARKYRALVELS
jgi:adenylosuccinate lyase